MWMAQFLVFGNGRGRGGGDEATTTMGDDGAQYKYIQVQSTEILSMGRAGGRAFTVDDSKDQGRTHGRSWG